MILHGHISNVSFLEVWELFLSIFFCLEKRTSSQIHSTRIAIEFLCFISVKCVHAYLLLSSDLLASVQGLEIVNYFCYF